MPTGENEAGFYLPYIRVKLKLFSPFCSLCVIFVILIRIYRMGESVHARERAREGFAVAKEKTGFRLFYKKNNGEKAHGFNRGMKAA